MLDETEHLEAQLALARRKHEEAFGAGGTVAAREAAHQELLRIERELARARGEPYAVPCDFPVRWCVGAPMPVLVRDGRGTYLAFHVSDSDPVQNEPMPATSDPDSPPAELIGLVTFQDCASAKLGHPNDEVQHGHFLAGRGLELYTAQVVMSSPWIAEIARTNSVHPGDDSELWKEPNHFVFWFHDETFECVARGFELELFRRPMGEVLAEIAKRMFG